MNTVAPPKGWVESTLGKVAKIERTTVQSKEIQTGTMYLGLEHITSEGQFTEVKSVEAGELASNKFAFNNQHLLYGKLRPYLKKIARPDFAGICSTDILPILPCPKVDRNFLYYYLRQPSYIELATARTTGANLPRLSPKALAEFPVFIPPLEEQRRIAAILDKADAVRRKRQEAIALTEELLRSAFLEMFGDPDTNQKGWEMKPLGEVCSRVTVGFVGTMALEYIEEGIPWLRSLNVKRNRITLNDLKYVSTNFHERVIKSSLSPGDVVAVRTGNAGVAAVVPTSISHANCADLIVMTCGSELVPTYLSETLNLLLGDRDGGTGLTGAIQKHFNIARAKQLMIPLPPLHDQENWATLVNQLERLQLTQEKDKEETHALFNSLLQRAFQGEL